MWLPEGKRSFRTGVGGEGGLRVRTSSLVRPPSIDHYRAHWCLETGSIRVVDRRPGGALASDPPVLRDVDAGQTGRGVEGRTEEARPAAALCRAPVSPQGSQGRSRLGPLSRVSCDSGDRVSRGAQWDASRTRGGKGRDVVVVCPSFTHCSCPSLGRVPRRA